MAVDALARLQEAGYPVGLMTEAQQGVLAALAEEEVEVLVSVQERLRDVSADVEGHDMKIL